MTPTDAIDAVRRPEYTGQNRCIPCTTVNVAIAVVLSTAVGSLVPPLGVLLFAVSVATIYLRGYLVPGTPALTRRYLPDRLLAAFDKEPRHVPFDAEEFDAGDFDAREFLVDSGLVRDDPDAVDLVLDPGFETAWYERMDGMDASDGGTGVQALAELVDLPAERLALDRRETSALVAYADDEYIGEWASRAALVADVTAARELDVRLRGWSGMPLAARSDVLAALRLFVERCPACGAAVELGDDVVTTCCRRWHVVTAECTGCDTRLLELDAEPETLDDAPTPEDGDDGTLDGEPSPTTADHDRPAT
jgi:hypothetical protein